TANAMSAEAFADTGGAKATLTNQTDLNLKVGGSVSLKTTHGYLYIYGDRQNAGSHANASADSHATATITATGNANITAGGNFTAAAGNSDLYIYGGRKVDQNANVKATGASGIAKLTTQANVSITAKGAVSLTAGSGSSDTAFIYGQNSAGGFAAVTGSTGGIANLDAEGTVKVKSGGAFTIGAGHSVDISGGNQTARSETIHGVTGTAGVIANNSVSLGAGTTLTVKLAGGNFNISGGTIGANHATLLGSGAGGKATLTDTQTVAITAVGAITENGANSINIVAGVFAATGTDAAVTTAGGGAGTATVNSGITIKGASVTMHSVVTPVSPVSRTTVTGGGLTETGKVTITGSPVHLLSLSPLFLAPVDNWSRAPMEVSPSTGGTSFGAPQSLGSLPDVSLLKPVTTTWVLPATTGLQISAVPVALSGLGSQGLVVQLVTLMSQPADGELSVAPAEADGTAFNPESSYGSLGSASCLAVFQGVTGQCRTSPSHSKR
ncbi:MAG: hypothetical protein ACM3ZT_08880, partial [Bacillota bacterium]